MLSLFDDMPLLPKGFTYHPGFITPAEEEGLLKEIGKYELHNMLFHGYTAKRKTVNFGYDWSFENRVLTKGKEIPAGFHFLMERAAKYFAPRISVIAELLITAYPPGAVINWHRDAPPYDQIIGISLQADCVFKFRPYDKAKQGRGAVISVSAARRSVYMMEGEARQEWEHSIDPVKKERYSITLRTLR